MNKNSVTRLLISALYSPLPTSHEEYVTRLAAKPSLTLVVCMPVFPRVSSHTGSDVLGAREHQPMDRNS